MRRSLLPLALLGALLLGAAPATAEPIDMDLASKIILKIMMLDRDLVAKTGGEIVVGVIGSPGAALAFRALEGEPIDKAKRMRVTRVVEYKKLPPRSAPTFLFVGEGADPSEVTRYTREAKLLSVTTVTSYVNAGVTLGIGVENNRPKVLLNLTGSEAERMSWDPKILKISRTIK